MFVCVRCVRIIEFVFFRISECVSPQPAEALAFGVHTALPAEALAFGVHAR